MIKTAFWLLGIMSLQYTDFTAQQPLYSTFLPVLDAVFLLFLLWQLVFFFTIGGSSCEQTGFSVEELFAEIYDLRYEIQDRGFIVALINLSLSMVDVVCMLIAIHWYLSTLVELIQV